MANYLACACLLRQGDEVLVEKPAYEPLLAIPRLLGAKVIRFERPFRAGFRIDMEELSEIGSLARRVKAHVLVDEVYLDFLFERRPRSSVHLGPQFVVTSSLPR